MIFTLTTISQPNDFPQDRPIWVAKSHPTATVGGIDVGERIVFDDSTATYRLTPVPRVVPEDIFISPILRSVPVTVYATIRGRIAPLPIEELVD